MTSSTRLVLDRRARRLRTGRVLVAGTPPRIFSLTERGRAAIDALARGAPPSDDAAALVRRLVDAGAVHPLLLPGSTVSPGLVTVVIPTRNATPRWQVGRCRTIVVDDASAVPVHVPGATAIRLADNCGPGGARNAGLAQVDTPFVAFVDSDVDIAEDALLHLAAHLVDDAVDLVAPRVTVDPGPDPRSRYERWRGPLDLGREPSPVAPEARVSYVPAAVLVGRTDALRAAGGFEAALRVGEDVELVWRLVAAGHRVRYDPSVIAHHRPRTTWRAWCAQRMGYGTSAALLDRRFPGAVSPVRADPWQWAPWVAFAVPGLGRWRAALVAGASTAAAIRLVRRLGAASTPLPPAEALRLVGRGQVYLGRAVASALVRVWWPLTAVAAATGRTGRRLLAFSLMARSAELFAARRHEPIPLDPLRAVLMSVLDDAAYGAGVWRGAWRERCVTVLLPRLVRSGSSPQR